MRCIAAARGHVTSSLPWRVPGLLALTIPCILGQMPVVCDSTGRRAGDTECRSQRGNQSHTTHHRAARAHQGENDEVCQSMGLHQHAEVVQLWLEWEKEAIPMESFKGSREG